MTTLIERITTLRVLVNDKSLTKAQRTLNAVKTNVLLEELETKEGYVDLGMSEKEKQDIDTKEKLFFQSYVPYEQGRLLHEDMRLPLNGEWSFIQKLIPYIIRKIRMEFDYKNFFELIDENLIKVKVNNHEIIWGFTKLADAIPLSKWMATYLHSEEIDNHYSIEAAKNKALHEIIRADLKELTGCKIGVSKDRGGESYEVCVYLTDSKKQILTEWYIGDGFTSINSLSCDMLTEYGQYIIKAMEFITNLYNYDNSNAQIDHFDVGYYTDIAIGNSKTDKAFSECKGVKNLHSSDYESMVQTMRENEAYEVFPNRLIFTLENLTQREFVFFVSSLFSNVLWYYDTGHDFYKDLIRCFAKGETIHIIDGLSFRVSEQKLIIDFKEEQVKNRLLSHFKIEAYAEKGEEVPIPNLHEIIHEEENRNLPDTKDKETTKSINSLLTEEIRTQLMDNYKKHSLSKNEMNVPPVAKLFDVEGNSTWLVTEIDPNDIMLGVYDLGKGQPTFGCISLQDLTSRKLSNGDPKIKLDLTWNPTASLNEYFNEAKSSHDLSEAIRTLDCENQD